MYTLFIANKNYSSWSLRPWALMRELGIPFEEKIAPFGSDSNWDEFRSFNPAGKVPCLHASKEADVVWDSLAIIEYLAERHEGVWPADGKARTWARCAAAEMHSGFGAIRQTCPMHVGFRIQMKPTSAAFNHDIARLNELWNHGLDQFGGPFLAGAKFTAIDAFFAPVVFRAQSYGLALNEKSNAYAKHLLQTNAMQQWQTEALKESWREPGHEDAALAAGTLLADLRT
ncbi:glutathione S-transferase family protein [Undibacterium sp. Ren11W]|uniref:glutathione S-transferase family protein n=1 Tax=Undibacterium sp. Ren11W TaxID=3413045 RepID=UPI003BEFFDAD